MLGDNMVSNPNSSISREELLDLVYPVGSVYISFNNTSPENFLGGTWTQIQDRFLLAASDTYPAGFNGGEATHLLNTNELPTYTNGSVYTHNTGNNKTGGWIPLPEGNNIGYGPLELGGNQPHNNMPPYIGVYMWRRTA